MELEDPKQPLAGGNGNGRRRAGIYLLPNLLTTGALFAGFYAVVAAINGRFVAAAVAIMVAGVLDGLDGRIARLTKTQSAFGVQYDSLSDLISFGLAPALVVYLWSLRSLAEYGDVIGKVGWLAAFLFAACAALRLARFNAQAGVSDKQYFQGLSSPAAAGVMITMVWALESESVAGSQVSLLALAVTIITALLMVSNVRYFSFKSWPDTQRVPFLWIFVLVLVFVLLALDPPKLLAGMALTYAISGPVLTVMGRVRHRSRRSRRQEQSADE